MTQMFEKAADPKTTGMARVMRNVSSLAKTNQTAGIEWADFAKESYAAGTDTMKQLAAARTLQSALEIQGRYLKASYERFQAQAKVMSDLYKGLAQEVGVPLAGHTPLGGQGLFDPKAFLDPKAFFNPKAFFDATTFPKLPGLPAMTAPKLAA